jgi:hypothetical protein
MRFLLSALVVCSGSLCAQDLHAQEVMPVGFVRGSLLSWQGSAASGSLTVQRADGAVYDCSYDAQTLFQRDQWPIHVADLNAGEPVEVLSDRRARVCYARMLSVVHRMPEPAGWRPHVVARPREGFQPLGNLTFGGVVIDGPRGAITIRTRAGERTLLLRSDTRFSGDGVRQEAPEPLLNKHVFVRAGRDIYGELEAYQIVWGEIFVVP